MEKENLDSRVYCKALEQGTAEWFEVRRGVVTASEFATVMAKGRGNAPSKTRQTYMYKLVGEAITGEVVDSYTNAHMERGKIMEEEARLFYELNTGNDVEPCGFIKFGHFIGYSPDGLVGKEGLVEIKTKLPHLQIAVLLEDKVPPEHMPQLQGGLWVSGRDWIDFVSYWPKLPVFIKRVYRDEEYIKNLDKEVVKFLKEMRSVMEKIK